MIAFDETLSGQRVHSFRVETLTERLLVREIIRARIWQEVQDYNAQQRAAPLTPHSNVESSGLSAGTVSAKRHRNVRLLVQPMVEESRLNDVQPKPFKPIDWEKQYTTALRAFETNGFFILIGDRQAESLDEEFTVEAETEVSFVKLLPLVGG